MNTRRAATLIIVLLLAINLFLGWFILRTAGQVRDVILEAEAVQKILSYRDIRISAPIPQAPVRTTRVRYTGPLFTEEMSEHISGLISGETILLHEDTLYIDTLMDIQSLTDRFEADAAFRKLMGIIQFDSEPFVLDSVNMEASGVFILRYVYKKDNQFLYDSHIRVRVSETGRIQCEIRQYQYVEEPLDEPDNVISAYLLLMSRLTRTDNRSMHIVRMDTGYLAVSDGETIHGWRILFDDGTARYFDTQTGEEIIPYYAGGIAGQRKVRP